MTIVTYTPAPRTLSEVLAGSHPTLWRATLTDGPRAGQPLPITGGRLTLDQTSDVRATANLDLTPDDDWEPVDVTDALDIRAGTTVLIEHGVRDDQGTEHWWPLATVLPSKNSTRRAVDDLTIGVEVDDPAYRAKLASIDRSWLSPATQGLLAGIEDALLYIAPWLPTEFDDDLDVAPGVDVLIAEKPGVDVWARCRDLAATLGLDLHVDELGTCVATPIPDPLATEPVSIPLLDWSESTDVADVVNKMGCPWQEARPDNAPAKWEPDSGWSWAVDTESSTSIHSELGLIVKTYSGDLTVITTPTHADRAASAELLTRIGLSRSASCTALMHPALRLGAVLKCPVHPEHDAERYVITKLDIELGSDRVRVTLGAPPPSMEAALSRPIRTYPYERMEIVVAVAPLTSRPVSEPGASPALVEATKATATAVVGDCLRVQVIGAGRRIATAIVA